MNAKNIDNLVSNIMYAHCVIYGTRIRWKNFFRAYARNIRIVWPYLWRNPRYATVRALNMVCKRCCKGVGDDEGAEGLQCDFCKGYMHASCGSIMKGLKRELLRAGREQKGVHWYCIECSQDVNGIFRCMRHAGSES